MGKRCLIDTRCEMIIDFQLNNGGQTVNKIYFHGNQIDL